MLGTRNVDRWPRLRPRPLPNQPPSDLLPPLPIRAKSIQAISPSLLPKPLHLSLLLFRNVSLLSRHTHPLQRLLNALSGALRMERATNHCRARAQRLHLNQPPSCLDLSESEHAYTLLSPPSTTGASVAATAGSDLTSLALTAAAAAASSLASVPRKAWSALLAVSCVWKAELVSVLVTSRRAIVAYAAVPILSRICRARKRASAGASAAVGGGSRSRMTSSSAWASETSGSV